MADPTIIPDDSISGNKVHGGVISQFQSTGIQDLSTQTTLVVSNGLVSADSIRTKKLDGNVEVAGNLTVNGTIDVVENVQFRRDIAIAGNLSANTLTVRNLIADVRQETLSPLTFIGASANELNGKGLVWKPASGPTHSLVYTSGRVSSSIDIDVAANHAYFVGGNNVLSSSTLGAGVINSSLKTLGTLQSLKVSGQSTFDGSTDFTGPVTFTGTVHAQTIQAGQVITTSGAAFEIGNFTADTESQLNGQGIHWKTPTTDYMLAYRSGGRLWINTNLDLSNESSYSINNIPVLTATSLGGSVTSSSLTTVGTLNSLAVSGDTVLADFAFFNSVYNRLGIGTDEPSAAINILENNVDIIIGSPTTNLAVIGTHSNHDVAIVTDGLPRITVKNSGEVNVGDPVNGGGSLHVYGTLYATAIETDNRIDRSQPLQFNATRDSSIYGLGMVWAGTGYTRQLIMMGGPDRLFSSESFDLAEGQAYHIGGTAVISQSGLGSSIVNSNLVTLGHLRELNVTGRTSLTGDVFTQAISANQITLNDLPNSSITSNSKVTIKVQDKEIMFGDTTQISIGDKTLQSKPVKVFGKLSVGINNPDPSVNFSVNGDVNIGGKRFTSNVSMPTSGNFEVGDICWNSKPQINSFVGWVCTITGNPGEWLGFGMISN